MIKNYRKIRGVSNSLSNAFGQVIDQIICNPGCCLSNPTHHAGVDYLTSCHGPNRIDGVGFRYFFFGPYLHDMVSFGIYPDAARFIGIDCRFQLRGAIAAWMG